MSSNWVKVTLAVITMLGSVIVSYTTSKSTSKDEVDEATKEFKAIHIESGIVEVTGNDANFNKITGDVSNLASSFTPRRFTKHVDFDKPFGFTPLVRMSLSAVDADKETNLRIQVYPTVISSKGFDAIIQTWSDTRINFASINWFAYEQKP